MHVGIVTFEFPGLTKNGGIGTAYGRMAENLLKAGHRVSVLFVNVIFQPSEADVRNQPLRKKYRNQFRLGLIDILKRSNQISEHTSWPLYRSHLVALEIKRLNFSPDILHFHDCLGLAWVTLSWQRHADFLPNTKIVLGMHGPNFWVRDAHGILTTNFQEFLESHLEREAYQLSENIISPSQYLLDYLSEKGWRQFQGESRVIANINDEKKLRAKKSLSPKPNQIVFFGRLEPRKGIFLFVETLKKIAQDPKFKNRQSRIVFLGRDTKLSNGQSAIEWVSQELDFLKKTFKLIFHSDYDSEECRQFFQKNPKSLVLLPSVADNSPYVIVESLEQGLNFICTNIGGQSELIAKDNVDEICVRPEPNVLAIAIIEKFFRSEQAVPKPSELALAANCDWLNFHKTLVDSGNRKKIKKLKPAKPSISILIRSQGELKSLYNTLVSIASQTILPLETIVCLNLNDMSTGTFEYISKVFKEFKMHFSKMKLQFCLVYGGWNDELLFASLKKVTAKYVFTLLEGDTLADSAMNTIASSVFNTGEEKSIVLFGMRLKEKDLLPGPLSLECNMFFDYISKFPMLFKNSLVYEKADHEDRLISNTFSLRSELILSRILKDDSVLCVPVVVLNSTSREAYHPYWPIWKDEFLVRLSRLKETLNPSEIELIESVYYDTNNSRIANV